jgi:hypothetical protein
MLPDTGVDGQWRLVDSLARDRSTLTLWQEGDTRLWWLDTARGAMASVDLRAHLDAGLKGVQPLASDSLLCIDGKGVMHWVSLVRQASPIPHSRDVDPFVRHPSCALPLISKCYY